MDLKAVQVYDGDGLSPEERLAAEAERLRREEEDRSILEMVSQPRALKMKWSVNAVKDFTATFDVDLAMNPMPLDSDK